MYDSLLLSLVLSAPSLSLALSLGGCWNSLKLRVMARFAGQRSLGAILGTLVCIRYVLIRRLLAVGQIKEIMVLPDKHLLDKFLRSSDKLLFIF